MTENSAPAEDGGRRRPGLLPRLVAAVAVCAVLGTGIAYGISSADRTDLPGLGTPDDGRWTYPEQHRPPLPRGASAPFADQSRSDRGSHHADLGALRLSAPEDATVDLDKKSGDGTPDAAPFTGEYAAPYDDLLRRHLADYAPRRTASRGWTMPDGTRSRVHLLQFDSAAVAEFFRLTVLSDARGPAVFLRDAQTVGRDDAYKKAVPKEAGSAVGGWFGSGVEVYKETGSEGALSVRYAYVFAGDTIALITHSRPGSTVPTAFYQSVALQQQLLG
ncbi:hypothetical protein [Streptomyces chrestomyceticus]|uniref:hypothetical protein n=1 Tax=Streptomyces chrestomyceticus TaxID=68185 RepID=UPI0033C30193